MGAKLAALGGQRACQAEFSGWPIFGQEEEQALLSVLRSGRWGCLDGQQVATFEKRFAAYVGARHGIAVCNGTVSLKIGLLAAGIQAGDEVIVPPYTFLATATSVVEANATPVFADIVPDTACLDPGAVEAAITPRTRAIVPVHLAGYPAEMDTLLAIARRHNLTVMEDAAHAPGSEYKGRRAGSLGHLASFSFQSSKNLCSGEGGMITTNDEALADRCRMIHNCGRVPQGKWYEHHCISGNYRMTEFQAALLNVQLDRYDRECDTRDRNGRYLAGQLAEIPGIHPQPRGRDETRHAYHLFHFRYDAALFGAPAEVFVKALTEEGVPCGRGYGVPLYRQPLFANKAFGPYTGYRLARPDLDFGKVHCPCAEQVCASGCWLGHRMLLGPREHMDQIAAAVRKLYECRAELRELAGATPGAATR